MYVCTHYKKTINLDGRCETSLFNLAFNAIGYHDNHFNSFCATFLSVDIFLLILK